LEDIVEATDESYRELSYMRSAGGTGMDRENMYSTGCKKHVQSEQDSISSIDT
jgi:sarcosine oxidase delta subunit